MSNIKNQNNQNTPNNFILTDDGLFYEKESGSVLVSDRIEVIAQTRDENNDNWGIYVKFSDPDKNTKHLALPTSIFAGDPKELFQRLFSAGFRVSYQNKKKFLEYLSLCYPSNRALCTKNIGWYKDIYVLPDEVIGDTSEIICFQSPLPCKDYKTKGSLDEWKEHIGKYCSGNSRLLLTVSTALAGPFLNIVGLESGGFHIYGDSGCGKSTAIGVAASVYSDQSFVRNWRTTDNGLEGVASICNDALLILDEVSQADPMKVGKIVYMLGNEKGKLRCNKHGDPRDVLKWRLLILSSGEETIKDVVTKSGDRFNAGQDIRLISLPAEPEGAKYKSLECIHDFPDGAKMSEYLIGKSKDYYGTPARALIKQITVDGIANVKEQYYDFYKMLSEKYLEKNADSQVKRVFKRFALVAYAGEYATKNNITGWQVGESISACMKCFNEWLKDRGGTDNYENKHILETVRNFFIRNGSSMFETIGNSDAKVINRVGFKYTCDDITTYYVSVSGFKNDICKGINHKSARSLLTKNGWIANEGRALQKTCNGTTLKVLEFTNKMWEEENAD